MKIYQVIIDEEAIANHAEEEAEIPIWIGVEDGIEVKVNSQVLSKLSQVDDNGLEFNLPGIDIIIKKS